MKITHTEIWKFSIPMVPFTIATGTMEYAQNIFIRIHTSENVYGVGECSAFPMIVGETQATCFEMAKDFSRLWKDQDASDIPARLKQLSDFTAFNATAKSAFDMALYDLEAKRKQLPLYKLLGGSQKPLETDLTIGIDKPEKMAQTAAEFVSQGVRIIKIKLGKNAQEDVLRVKLIRQAVGDAIRLRIDANQGWSFDDAAFALKSMEPYQISFCEQPMRSWYDHLLPELRRRTNIKIMADESVFNAFDAERLIRSEACDFVNIKFAKSGGIHEALRINAVCQENSIPCMMGGMLESRVALSAFAHFALACDNIIFYDMDTCLLGHKTDPVVGGARYNGYIVEVPETPGIGADADQSFLDSCEKAVV